MRKLFATMGFALSLTVVGCGEAATNLSERPAAQETSAGTVRALADVETDFNTPRFVVEEDDKGTRVLHPVIDKKIDRLTRYETKRDGWESGTHEGGSITCNAYIVRRAGGGTVGCGMVCSDNTYYPMDCDADIFKGVFDISAVAK
ncbi:hypothetical protein ACLESD_19040 [Pyxidicoccus sp. 3LFB2]